MSFIIDGYNKDDNKETEESLHNQFDMADDSSETDIKESTELGDSLKELNKDTLEPGTRMSSIDMRANLHYVELSSILACDALVMFRVLPVTCLNFTRQKKRLSPSLQGKGREDIVNIVSGKKEMDAKTQSGTSLGDRLRGLFGKGGGDQQ